MRGVGLLVPQNETRSVDPVRNEDLKGGKREVTPSALEGPRKVVSYNLDGTVFDMDHDPLEQVIDFINRQEEQYLNKTKGKIDGNSSGPLSFLEVSSEMEMSKVHGFCEICILVMQMKERGQPHLCAGLNPDYFISCVENLESLLRADKAVTYWLRSGCMHLDREGPEIVRCVLWALPDSFL